MILPHRLGCFVGMGMSLLACGETSPSLPDDGEHSPALQSGGALFETFDDAKARQDQQRSRALETSIETLPGVVQARVHLTTPARSRFGKPDDAKSGAAVLVVRDNEKTPTTDTLKAFVLAAVPELGPESVQVFFTVQRAPPAPETVSIGPNEVTRASAGMARVILGALLSICLIASAGLIGAGLKLRRLRNSDK